VSQTAASADIQALTDEIKTHAEKLRALTESVERVIVGQEGMIRGLLIGLLSDGHVLLEGVPGLAKTLTITSLARAMHAEFKRIQFTPDLLPADVVGTQVYNPKTGEFTPKQGPVFANFVLADEINRAPAKVQSALLEAMQERTVTIGDQTYDLPAPFLVLATQNPVEQEGTYPLPEAQVDRFMLKLRVGYPTRSQERAILDRMAGAEPVDAVHPVLETSDLLAARDACRRIHVDAKIRDYIVDLVHATREPVEAGLDIGRLIEFGASPRATIALTHAARAHAFLEGRGYVTPHDVKSVAMDVLRHRVTVSYEAEAEELTSENIVAQILDHVPVP